MLINRPLGLKVSFFSMMREYLEAKIEEEARDYSSDTEQEQEETEGEEDSGDDLVDQLKTHTFMSGSSSNSCSSSD